MFKEIILLRKFFATLPTVILYPFTGEHTRCFTAVNLLMSKWNFEKIEIKGDQKKFNKRFDIFLCLNP